MDNSRLKVQNISKSYPGTLALDDVSLDFRTGEIHALLGKNGAGKSTLVKIISGAIHCDRGEIFLDGKQIHLSNPRDALSQGIVCVYQELSLVPGLTIAENILLGRIPRRNRLGIPLINWNATYALSRSHIRELGLDLDVTTKVNQITIAEQQIVEIARAMSYKPSVLILDEPTSALAYHEVEELFRLIRKLASQGVAIIYISHRLQEVLQISDRISVLRDAHLVGTISTSEASPAIISNMMFGEDVTITREISNNITPKVVLSVEHLSRKDTLHDVSLQLHEGEVLGLAGLIGSGRSEVLRILFGVDSYDEACIELEGKRISPQSPRAMKGLGIAMTPEDRKHQGLVQLMSIKDNLSLAYLGGISHCGILNKRRQRNLVDKVRENLHIQFRDAENPVFSLSGGNQQKVVIGKWLSTNPRVLFMDEPTRGVDIHAKQEIFKIIHELSTRGVSIIFVSTELEEVLQVAHRILVMKKGRITENITEPEKINLNQLMEMCIKE